MKQFILLLILGFSHTLWSQTSLEGNWQIDADKKFAFREDGTFTQIQYDKTYIGNYNIQDEALVLTYPNGTKSYKIISRTTDQMVIGNESNNSTSLILKREMPKEMAPDLLDKPLTEGKTSEAAHTNSVKETGSEVVDMKTKEVNEVPVTRVEKSHQNQSVIKVANTYDVNRLRIGVKLLLPGIAGLHTEYVLPFLKNNIAATFDYSHLPGKWFSDSGAGVNFGYWKVGANYYFSNSGSGTGFYGGLHYQKLIGSLADINLGIGGFGGVLGFKTKGRVFFGAELGLSKADIDIIAENGKNYGYIPNLNISFGVAFL